MATSGSRAPEHDELSVWQDREIRFDVPLSMLAMRRGEFQIDWMNSIEDTKGNNGEKGTFIATNLRMIWFSNKSQHTNLCLFGTLSRH